MLQRNVPPHWVGAKVCLGEGLAGQVVQTKKPMVVEDYLNWRGRLEAFSDSPARRVLGVPLKTHDQITGVIVLIDKQVGTFSDDEIRLASLFKASFVESTTIKNTLLFKLDSYSEITPTAPFSIAFVIKL